MVFFIFLTLITVLHASAVHVQFHSDTFIKSNTYAEENSLILSRAVGSQLMCSSYCAEINTCSMIIIETTNAGNPEKLCHIHEVINNDNTSYVNEDQIEIWYKKTPEQMEEACPAGFTKLNAGCFHANPDPGNWNDAYFACKEGQLAVFESVQVRKHHVIFSGQCTKNIITGSLFQYQYCVIIGL